jgi:hypothetical protein
MAKPIDNDRVDLVREAQELLFEAINKLDDALKGTPHRGYFEAYIVDHLRIYASSNHSFLSGDPNLDELIKALEDPEV